MISSEEIKKLGLLARIEIGASEEKELQKELEAILGYVSKLKEAPPPSGEAGSAKETKISATLNNVFREDNPIEDKSEAKKGEHFKVKHIL